MKYSALALILLFSLTKAGTFAQSPQSADTIPPFEGTIGYQITYAGGNAPGLATLLPDSMLLQVKYPWIKASWFGGISDTLMHEVIWYAGSNQYFMPDHQAKVVFRLPVSTDSIAIGAAQVKFTKTKEVAKLAGMNTIKYTSTSGTFSDSWWLSKEIFIRPDSIAIGSGDSVRIGLPPFLAAGRNEIPLKFSRKSAEGTTISTAVSVTRLPLDETQFRFPEGYLIEEFDRLQQHHPLFSK